MINTILVEDDLYIQKHFIERLNAEKDFRLVGVYRDAFEAERYCNGSVQLILMDVQTQHKHSGLAAAERIKKTFPNIKIVIVTSLVDPEVLTRAKTGDADSLWYKDHGTAELLDVINRTLNGENVFPNISPAVEMENAMSDVFSPRQLDILRWYIRGLTYQEIADKFGISKNGVRWNLDDMVEKGGFENREALVATAIENKLMVTTLKDE
ncbi:MAG TPA: DNA-binding response regulator [Ruminococcaceae bacterium]|nr:DNA-binding response regulator [Oscillospiraceae bacterium]